MADTLGKRLEIALRRFIVKLLRRLVRRESGPVDLSNLSEPKILFIRQDMLGDVLVSTPLFSAIRSRYPRALMDAVLSPKNHMALENNHHIRKKWIYKKTLGEAVQLIKYLRLERYDFAIDLMDNPSVTSTILSLLAGAKWNVGIEKENSYAYDIRVPLKSRKEFHIIDRLGELLRPFGIDPGSLDLRPEYTPRPEAQAFAEEFFKRHQLAGSPVLGINISAGTETRFWGTDKFRSIVQLLSLKLIRGKILVLFKPSDEPRARTIAEGMSSVILSDSTPSFDHFAALVQRLSFLLTPDTSAVHLASAFRLPSVVLYVQSNPDLRIWDPYKTPSRTIVTPVDDLSTIPVDTVLAAVESLLAETGMTSRSQQ